MDPVQSSLCVLYDAGETTALLPVLKKWESENRDFRVLVMATAEKQVKSDMFIGKRLTLNSLGIKETVDDKTARTTSLGLEALKSLNSLKPRVVLVGTASRIQEQVLEKFSSESTTIAFVDNFNYDPSHESFATVAKVQKAAQHVLCPSQNVIDLFTKDNPIEFTQRYKIVGKPSLELWEKEISEVDRKQILQELGLHEGKPIVTFIGGYGEEYNKVVNSLFAECREKLQENGYQVILQPHPKVAQPKVKTTEALAVSDYVVGYNSSVILDAAIIGKNALYIIPKEVPYHHFAIDKGLISEVSNVDELLAYIRQGKRPSNVRQALNIPANSTEIVSQFVDQLARCRK